MPPTPKPPGARVRRNKEQPKWEALDGPGRKAPLLPRKKPTWLKSTREWWAHLWASPMSSIYTDADLDSLFRLARLKDFEARGDLPISGFSALQTLEDRFGLSPKARQMLQWQMPKQQEATPSKAAPGDELAKRREQRRKVAEG